MKAVVLAATRGHNLGPLTTSRPKAMSIVRGRPLLEYHLRALAAAGVSEACLVTGHGAEQIEQAFGCGEAVGLDLAYRRQPEQNGIGQALLLAEDQFADEDFMILVYADHFTTESLVRRAMQVFHHSRSPVGAVALTRSNRSYGNVFFGENGRIYRLLEKPANDKMGNYVLAGVYVLPTKIFRLLKEREGSMEAALQGLVEEGEFRASIYDGDWMDIDFPWSLLRANQAAMDTLDTMQVAKDAVIEANVSLEGPAIIESGVTIKAGSTIQGPCFIGRGSYIGNHALIRKHTSLGPECLIGYGVELKNCIFYGKTSLGRLSFVGDSVIGWGARIGSGVMTVNETEGQEPIDFCLDGQRHSSAMRKLGSFIGDGAVIGASNTLGPGTVIPAEERVPHNVTYTRSDLS